MTLVPLRYALVPMVLCLVGAEGPSSAAASCQGRGGAVDGKVDDGTVSIEFRVTGPDGVPLSRALVWVRAAMEQRPRLKYGQTDGDGRVTLEAPTGAELTWLAKLSNGGEERRGTLAPLMADEAKLIEVVLRTEDDATFRGKFVDADTGDTLEGVQLIEPQTPEMREPAIVFPLGLERLNELGVASSDAKGEVEVSAATWGPDHLIAIKGGYSVVEIEVGGNEDARGLKSTCLIPMYREPLAAFRVVGLPEGMELRVECPLIDPFTLQDRRTATFSATLSHRPGAANLVEVHGLAQGQEARLWLVEGGAKLYELPRTRIQNRGSEEIITLDLPPLGEVTGLVRDANGRPLAGSKVYLRRLWDKKGAPQPGAQRSWPKESWTDSAGRYYFERLLVGHYEVTTAQPYQGGGLSSNFTLPVRFEMGVGEEYKELDLVALSGEFLWGTILGPDQRPHVGFVTAKGPHRELWAMTDAVGRFRVGPFRRGEVVSLTAKAAGHGPLLSSEPLEVPVPGRGLRARLIGMGQLAGRVTEFSPVGKGANCWVTALNEEEGIPWATHPNDRGEFSFGWKREGTYKLSLQSRNGRAMSDVVEAVVHHLRATEDVQVRQSQK